MVQWIPASSHISSELLVFVDAEGGINHPSRRTISFWLSRIRSESSNGPIYTTHFYSNQRFISSVRVHVNTIIEWEVVHLDYKTQHVPTERYAVIWVCSAIKNHIFPHQKHMSVHWNRPTNNSRVKLSVEPWLLTYWTKSQNVSMQQLNQNRTGLGAYCHMVLLLACTAGCLWALVRAFQLFKALQIRAVNAALPVEVSQ